MQLLSWRTTEMRQEEKPQEEESLQEASGDIMSPGSYENHGFSYCVLVFLPG